MAYDKPFHYIKVGELYRELTPKTDMTERMNNAWSRRQPLSYETLVPKVKDREGLIQVPVSYVVNLPPGPGG